MLKIIILITGILFLCLIANLSYKRAEILSYGGVFFGVLFLYYIVPIIDLIYLKNSSRIYVIKIIEASTLDMFFYSSLVLLFFLSYTLTYLYHNTIYEKIILTNNIKHQLYVDRLQRISRFLAWSCFFVGGSTLLIYIYAFGGVKRLLSYANLLRSFNTSGTDYVSYFASIMVIPARLITVSPIMFLVYMDTIPQKNLLYKGAFVVSLTGTCIFLLSNAGKSPIIIYLMMLLYPILKKITKYPWIVMVIGGVVASPILGILDNLFVIFSTGTPIKHDLNILQSLTNYLPDFSYEASNALNCQKIVDMFGLRWGKDYITGFLNVIPGINFSVSYYSVSQFYGGTNWSRIGGTPTDIVTFGYMEFSVLGVMLNGTLLGFFSRQTDKIINSLEGGYGIEILKAAAVLNFYNVLLSADVAGIARTQFIFISVIICAFYLNNKKEIIFTFRRNRK